MTSNNDRPSETAERQAECEEEEGISQDKGNTSPMTDLYSQIAERLDDAREEAEESHTAAHNSYGAGYDAGFVAGLRWVLEMIEDTP